MDDKSQVIEILHNYIDRFIIKTIKIIAWNQLQQLELFANNIIGGFGGFGAPEYNIGTMFRVRTVFSSKRNLSNTYYTTNNVQDNMVAKEQLIQHFENSYNAFQQNMLESLPALPRRTVGEEYENTRGLGNLNNSFVPTMPPTVGGYTRRVKRRLRKSRKVHGRRRRHSRRN